MMTELRFDPSNLEIDGQVGTAIVSGPLVKYHMKDVKDNFLACACYNRDHWVWLNTEAWDFMTSKGWPWRIKCPMCAAREDDLGNFRRPPFVTRWGWIRYWLAYLEAWATSDADD